MGNNTKSSKMKFTELKEKILEGSRLAFEELVKRKQKENGFLIVSENGKVVKKKASEIKLNDR